MAIIKRFLHLTVLSFLIVGCEERPQGLTDPTGIQEKVQALNDAVVEKEGKYSDIEQDKPRGPQDFGLLDFLKEFWKPRGNFVELQKDEPQRSER